MTKEEKLAIYEYIASQTVYHEPNTPNFHNGLIDSVVTEFITPLELPLNSTILDVGCGSGYFIDKMNKLGYTDVSGTTMSDDDLEACKNLNAKVTKASFLDIPSPSNSVDFVFCRHSIEHSPYPFFVLLELNRILKSGGKVYIEVPAENTEREHERNANHYSIMGHRMWASLADRAGFTIDFLNDYKFDLNEEIGSGITSVVKECFYMMMFTKKYDLIKV